MKFQHVLQTILFFSAGAASAFPVANLNDANCGRKSQTQNFRDLIQKASYMDEDDRELLSKNVTKIGFNAAEQEQAMRCTGRIRCPGAPGQADRMQSAGAICPPGHRSSSGDCASDRLGTVAHMFVNKITNRFQPGIDKCEFKTYRGHVSKLVISDVTNVINPRVDAQNPHKNVRADKIVIRLKNPIPNCDPYDLDEQPISPRPGTEVVALTYPQADQSLERFTGEEPIAYNCFIKRTYAPEAGAAGATYSDCDVNGVGSGGFMLTRNSDNRLAVTGLFSGSGRPDKNGQPYNEATKNFTVAISPNADFVKLALRPGIRPEPQITQVEVPTQRPTSN